MYCVLCMIVFDMTASEINMYPIEGLSCCCAPSEFRLQPKKVCKFCIRPTIGRTQMDWSILYSQFDINTARLIWVVLSSLNTSNSYHIQHLWHIGIKTNNSVVLGFWLRGIISQRSVSSLSSSGANTDHNMQTMINVLSLEVRSRPTGARKGR